LDAVFEMSKIGLSAALHVKIGVAKADVKCVNCHIYISRYTKTSYWQHIARLYDSNAMNDHIKRCEAGGSATRAEPDGSGLGYVSEAA